MKLDLGKPVEPYVYDLIIQRVAERVGERVEERVQGKVWDFVSDPVDYNLWNPIDQIWGQFDSETKETV